jgi:hypothetical protein
MQKNNKVLLINDGTTPAVYRTSRNVILWRTPGFGFIEMYINPSELRIEQSKVAQSTRTKAGFIYQYAGENLTTISLSGTTGSSGIEGINLLEKIYRSEQLSFENIARTLDANPKAAASIESALTSMFSGAFTGAANTIFNEIVDSVASAAVPDVYTQPSPTLASLAAAVEMNFQGVTYRGFFNSFSFTESASSPGLFEYIFSFTAYAKLGERINFMPWHRRPEGQSDSNSKTNYSLQQVEAPGFILEPPDDVQNTTTSQEFATTENLRQNQFVNPPADGFVINPSVRPTRPISVGANLAVDPRFR